jgi:uncharacterized OB-fold protein
VSNPPVAANLFTTHAPLRLLGGRHRQSGRIVFPLPDDPAYESIELPSRGILWSFTIQRFAPKSPPYRAAGAFLPFAVGYVELPGALIVESRLTDVDFEHLHVGMPMQLTTMQIGAEGAEAREAYAFRPSADSDAAP